MSETVMTTAEPVQIKCARCRLLCASAQTVCLLTKGKRFDETLAHYCAFCFVEVAEERAEVPA